jgi:hypothetical protein
MGVLALLFLSSVGPKPAWSTPYADRCSDAGYAPGLALDLKVVGPLNYDGTLTIYSVSYCLSKGFLLYLPVCFRSWAGTFVDLAG